MKASVIRIGNSRGIRLPKPILEQCGIEDEVEIEVEGGRLIIRPATAPRAGWSEAFGEGGEDTLRETPAPEWDESEWEW
ncbi:MAG: AbrB/MazE/SpoVT family DNA-binding domain-containing protein [Acidobacteria bacterium]|nr:AbrB/MazE/SpoVT family DNA-binding domain-containing protein [Acidobacteriota bacterium]